MYTDEVTGNITLELFSSICCWHDDWTKGTSPLIVLNDKETKVSKSTTLACNLPSVSTDPSV